MSKRKVTKMPEARYYLLPMKMEEGPAGKECRWFLEMGKGKEMDLPLEPLEGANPADT